jgi:acetate kinase
MEGDGPDRGQLLADGLVEKWGTPQATLRMALEGQAPEHRCVAAESSGEAAEHAIRACLPLGIDAVGHRVVHGGAKFEEPTVVTPEVVEGIRQVSHLAPLHNQLALAGIEAGMRVLPDTPAVAVFDTAFHRTMPAVAAEYAIPRDLAQKHELRRYGFHGISHGYLSGKLLKCLGREAAGTRLITCHLGNGSSICAVRDGRSVDTSMGMTPMEGLVMGTRSGDIDPGLVLHLIDGLGMSSKEVDEMLNRKSGLLGLSGRSGDVRDLTEAAASGDRNAHAALESFAYRARKYIGAYAAVLGGIDAIAFGGGIGEHSADVRSRICSGLEVLGILLNEALNASATGRELALISADNSPGQIWIVPTNEEGQIAHDVFYLLDGKQRTSESEGSARFV